MDGELALLNRAAGQDGLIARADALKLVTLSMLAWRLAKKRWVEARPRVYLVTGAPPTREQSMRAVALWLRRGFAFSHATAASLHGFRGYAPEGDLEVTTRRRVRAQRGLRVHVTQRLPKCDLTKLGELDVTTVERTVFDLALTEPNLRAVVDQLLARKKTTVDRLELALRRLDPRGRSRLWKLIDAYRGGDAPTESELEREVFAVLERARLPRPVKQKALYISGRLRRLDFLFASFGVVLEADGYLTHSTVEAFEEDRQRQNALMEQELLVLRWTWKAIKQTPEQLVAQLRALLIKRGWNNSRT